MNVRAEPKSVDRSLNFQTLPSWLECILSVPLLDCLEKIYAFSSLCPPDSRVHRQSCG